MLVNSLGYVPRQTARAFGAAIGTLAFHAFKRLRNTGLQNLALAYRNWTPEQREKTLREVYRNLGYQLAEFCQMRKYTIGQASAFVEYDGLDHYLAARDRGKGVLVLTGHLGAWELSSFYHSLVGYPMGLVIRRLDNPLVDALVNRIRCLHGNRVIHKDDFARGLISVDARWGDGWHPDGHQHDSAARCFFVPFFGVEACTASGLARVALRRRARRCYQAFCFGMTAIGQEIRSAVWGAGGVDSHRQQQMRMWWSNTTAFAADHGAVSIRANFPDQWLWMHQALEDAVLQNDAKYLLMATLGDIGFDCCLASEVPAGVSVTGTILQPCSEP